MVHKVERKDYVDNIEVSGAITPRKTVQITCPRIWSNNITIAYLIEEGVVVKKGDTVCILEASDIKIRYENEVDEVAVERTGLIKLKADLALKKLLLQSQLQSNEVQTSIVNLDSMQLQFSTESQRRITELELQKAEVINNKLINKLAFQERINGSDLKKKGLEIKKKENSVNMAREQLNKLTLTSMQDGMVVYSINRVTREIVKEGDRIFGSLPIVEIPEYEQFDVELNVSERYYKRIEKGQHVKVLIDAKPGAEFIGKVERKSPVGKPISRGSKVKFFNIIISLDGTGHDLQSGLSALCRISINSVADTVVVPIACVFEGDSTKVVYVSKNRKFHEREVELGLGNNKETIIEVGLNSDEVIALIKPPDKLIVGSNKD